jgi:hypothetical protein
MLNLNCISEENKNLLFRQFEIAEVVQCSYCKRYEWQDGEWKIFPETLAIEGISGNITHSVCKECLDDRFEIIC